MQADELIERMGYQDIEVGAQTHQIAHYLNCGNLDPAMAIVRDLEATGDVIPFRLSKRLKEWDALDKPAGPTELTARTEGHIQGATTH